MIACNGTERDGELGETVKSWSEKELAQQTIHEWKNILGVFFKKIQNEKSLELINGHSFIKSSSP